MSKAVATGWHSREALTAAQQADSNPVAPHVVKEKAHLLIAAEQVGREVRDALMPHKTEHSKDVDLATARHAPTFANGASPAANGYFLKTVHDLAGQDRITLVCAQLIADVASLGKALKAAGQDSDQLEDAIKALAGASDHEREQKARELANQLAQKLTAMDFRLGKAFALGWDLAALRRVGENSANYPSTFAEHFLIHQPDITSRLTDLASALPANAGHCVRASVGFWGKALTTQCVPEPGDVMAMTPAEPRVPRADLPGFTQDDVAEQLGRWRALLTAEKAAKDELEPTDYVDVAGGLSGQLAATVKTAVVTAPAAIAVIGITALTLIVVGVIAIVFSAHTAAGVTALVGAMGVTWKGLGTTVGKSLAKVEQPAWDAQMDYVIARRITHKEIRRKIGITRP